MSLIHDIHNQPHHIRRTMFTLSLVVLISGVGVIWLNSFQKNMYALLNPPAETVEDGSSLAEGKKASASPFALIGDAFKSLRASIADIFNSNSTLPTVTPEASRPPVALPISAPR